MPLSIRMAQMRPYGNHAAVYCPSLSLRPHYNACFPKGQPQTAKFLSKILRTFFPRLKQHDPRSLVRSGDRNYHIHGSGRSLSGGDGSVTLRLLALHQLDDPAGAQTLRAPHRMFHPAGTPFEIPRVRTEFVRAKVLLRKTLVRAFGAPACGGSPWARRERLSIPAPPGPSPT